MESDSGGSLYAQLLLIFVLTLMNAFFAASEMAMVSVDKKKLIQKSEEGDKKAELLLELLSEPSKFLSTIQVGITFAGFFSSGTAAINISDDLGRVFSQMGIPYGNTVAFVLITLLLAYVTLVFGELVPKRIDRKSTRLNSSH